MTGGTTMKRLLGIALLSLFTIEALAQSYPARQILMVVPLQAGTAVDNVARAIAQKMSISMGQTVVVENQAGASGQIGTERIAKAAPDGYTIGFVNDSILTMLPNLNAKLPYDPLKDLAPVSRVAGNNFGIAVPANAGAKTLAELLAQARDKPGAINFSSGGSGSPQHMAMEMLGAAAGVKMTHVPYKGAAQALTDLVGGQVQVLAQGLGVMVPQAKAGKLRLLATTGTTRSPLTPDVPTVREAGLAGFEFATWFAVVAPAGTPRALIDRLNAEILRAAALPEVREQLQSAGYVIYGSTPEQLTESISDGLARMGRIIRDANIRLE
jgi:tripartite-type tricarboxylate transporter receptor subunit TctC